MVTYLLSKVFGKRASAPDEAAPEACPAAVEDRRVEPRYDVRDETRIFVTRRPLSAIVVDISHGGARFATRLARDVGTVVGLEIRVDGQTQVLPLRVLWDKWNGTYFEHGGVFVELTPDEKAHIRRYVAWAMENPSDAPRQEVADVFVARALEAVGQLEAMR